MAPHANGVEQALIGNQKAFQTALHVALELSSFSNDSMGFYSFKGGRQRAHHPFWALLHWSSFSNFRNHLGHLLLFSTWTGQIIICSLGTKPATFLSVARHSSNKVCSGDVVPSVGGVVH